MVQASLSNFQKPRWRNSNDTNSEPKNRFIKIIEVEMFDSKSVFCNFQAGLRQHFELERNPTLCKQVADRICWTIGV